MDMTCEGSNGRLVPSGTVVYPGPDESGAAPPVTTIPAIELILLARARPAHGSTAGRYGSLVGGSDLGHGEPWRRCLAVAASAEPISRAAGALAVAALARLRLG
jgi:hypothetical protein